MERCVRCGARGGTFGVALVPYGRPDFLFAYVCAQEQVCKERARRLALLCVIPGPSYVLAHGRFVEHVVHRDALAGERAQVHTLCGRLVYRRALDEEALVQHEAICQVCAHHIRGTAVEGGHAALEGS